MSVHGTWMKYDFVQQIDVNKQEDRGILFNLVMNMAYTALEIQLFVIILLLILKGYFVTKYPIFLLLYNVLNQNNKNVLIFYWQP